MRKAVRLVPMCAEYQSLLLTIHENPTPKMNPASDFVYEKSENGITITKLNNDQMKGTVVIPMEIDGLPITAIGTWKGDEKITHQAFFGGRNLTSAAIPGIIGALGGSFDS